MPRVRRLSTVYIIPALLMLTGCMSASGASTIGPLEKTTINVDAFQAIDSAGLFIAEMDGLFAKEGLTVNISLAQQTQQEIAGQESGKYDVSLGDYVTYIDNELNMHERLLIVGESSFLQPNVLTLVTNHTIQSVGQLRGQTLSVNAPDDIGTLLIDSLMLENGVALNQFRYNNNVQFPDVLAALTTGHAVASFAPEPFVSIYEEKKGLEELADLDQGATANFPVQGVAVTQAWAQRYPNTLKAFVTALNEGQEIADTDRPAVEKAIEKFLQLPAQVASLVALPTYPIGVDPTRLQRVVNAMVQFGILPKSDSSFRISSMIENPR
jgi:NitT/TauT family transport system substrate-binding protein